MSTKAARAKLAFECYRGLREGDGCLPEADADINNASRAVIAAMHEEHGKVWLGHINLDSYTRDKPVLVEWKPGDMVYNFSAEFVYPGEHDSELVRLILARDEPDPKGYTMKRNKETLDAILKRVEELGGVTLLWT